VNDKQDQQVQTAIRLPESVLSRADKLAERLSQPGMTVTRTEVLRLALHKGLAELESERKKKS
jgi:predicted DNA-binding protein